LEGYEHTGQPRTIRTAPNIQEVAMLVCARQMVGKDVVAAADPSCGTCHKMLSDDLVMSHVPRILMQDERDDHMNTYGDLIDSADKDGMFLSWIIIGDLTWRFLYSATEVTINHLEIATITKTEETRIG
jgi:hypothetical protein